MSTIIFCKISSLPRTLQHNQSTLCAMKFDDLKLRAKIALCCWLFINASLVPIHKMQPMMQTATFIVYLILTAWLIIELAIHRKPVLTILVVAIWSSLISLFMLYN